MSRRAIDIRILGKQRTGDETVFFELTKEVLRQDKENEYLLLTTEDRREDMERLTGELGLHADDHKRRIVILPVTNRFWWNLFVLPMFLWREKVDLLHTQYILPFWLPSHTRVVDHIHDVSFCALPEYIGKKDLFFLEQLIPRSLERSQSIIVPSQFTKEEVKKYYQVPDEKIKVIHNALSTRFLEHAKESAHQEGLQKKYTLPDTFLLYVGTLQPRKNIPQLIRAFDIYQTRFPESRLVIVGNRESHHYDHAIDEALRGSSCVEKIIFPGYIDAEDLPQLIALAEVFVFPSLYEGFGIPLLEAMSQNVPVLASDIASLREVGGSAALYFDPQSVDSLVQKLYSLKDSAEARLTLKEAGKQRVGEFSWVTSGTSLLELYREVLARK